MSPVQAIKRIHTSFNLKQITLKQRYILLVSLPNGKANGIDIPNKMPKISAHVISSSLTDIFNCCISIFFQTILKLPKLHQFLRQAQKMILATTEPFPSLLSLLGYLKSLYMINYIYLNSNNLLGKQQWGFRKMHSTVLASQSTTNNWILNTNNGRANAVIFSGSEKSF